MTIKRKAADSPMVLRTKDGAITPVHDNRTDHLPRYSPETVRGYRDVEGGFWVASTKPEADFEAITGSLPTTSILTAGLFSDGTSRLIERHGMNWAQLLGLLEGHGPSQVIARVREADENVEPGSHRGKVHDDATAALCRFRGLRHSPARHGKRRSTASVPWRLQRAGSGAHGLSLSRLQGCAGRRSCAGRRRIRQGSGAEDHTEAGRAGVDSAFR